MQKRQVPYARSNFEEVITGKYYYIDKTQYIENLEKFKTPVFLRPRRFGKSLFAEMLKWYYDIRAEDRFNELFGHLYIGQHPTPARNSYFFLKFDFSGMGVWSESDKNIIKRQFDNKIHTYLESFLIYYKSNLHLDDEDINEFNRYYRNDSTGALKKVIDIVARNRGKIFLAIDEYDSLTNALAIHYQYAPEKDNEYLNVLRKGGFFRGFFETIKEGLGSSLDRVYITGILPITIADMNSGFNVAEWVSFEPELINMLGVTESEFIRLLNEIYDENDISVPKQKVRQAVKQYYNGYRFSPDSEYVYNPMMTLFYLKSLIHNNRIPDDFTDSNIRIDYNQIAFLFGNNYKKRDEVIEKISRDKQVIFSSKLNVCFDMTDYKNGNYIIEGLFYSGILTFSDDIIVLKIPNLVTYERALSYFERTRNFEIEKKDFGKWIFEYLRKGNVEYLIEGFFTEVIQMFPGDFFSNVNESFYHGLLFHLIYTNTRKDIYEVLPEFGLPDGKADIMVCSYPKSTTSLQVTDLFEIKRVPKSATDKNFSAKFEEGKQQMQLYRQGRYKNWRGIVVCFRGNKDYRIEVLK
ncbi:MAG: AAA family ATPase [Bacteroidetes bacterium]|nr:AAA family ATPase [Bacteroidota bacterium]